MELYLKLIDVLFPVFLVIGIGFYLGKKVPSQGTIEDADVRKAEDALSGSTDVMKVADNNLTMPPKTTWFDPKPLDGLVVYEFDQ